MVTASAIFNQLGGILFGSKPRSIPADSRLINRHIRSLPTLNNLAQNSKRKFRGMPNFGPQNAGKFDFVSSLVSAGRPIS